MKKIVFVIFSVLIPLYGFGAPRIHFEMTNMDFGVVQADSEEKYIFRFLNKGNETLVITKIEAG